MANEDPFDSEKFPSVSWKDAPIGTVITGTVASEASLVQSTDYESGDPAFWDKEKTQPKMSAVITLEIDGEKRNLWAQKPSALLNAISEAKKKANAGPMKPGGILKIKLTGEEEVIKNGRKLNPKKLFAATYTPPVDTAPADEEPPF